MSCLTLIASIAVQAAVTNGVEVSWFEEMVPMRDGTRLYTCGALPPAGETRALVVTRTPYARREPQDMVACAYRQRNALARGYAFVQQHVRGSGRSEGERIVYVDERTDGLDFLAWVRTLPHYRGEVFLEGASYDASVHWSYLDAAPDDVKGAVLSVQDVNRYNIHYRNGNYKIALHGNWTIREHKKNDLTLKRNPSAKFTDLPLQGFSQRRLGERVADLEEAWEHPRPGDAWWRTPGTAGGEYRRALLDSRMPVLLVTGFYDIYTEGIFDMWRELPAARRANCALVVDTDGHGDRARDEEDGPLDWFDWCRGRTDALKRTKPGMTVWKGVWSDTWESAPEMTDAPEKLTFRLADGGRLSSGASACAPVAFAYDPKNPPAFNAVGCLTFGGRQEQPETGWCRDVVTFTSAPLAAGMHVRGRMRLHLAVTSDCEDTAFYVRLSVKKAENGKWYNVRDDIRTLLWDRADYVPGERVTLDYVLSELAATFAKGDVLRLEVAGASANQFLPHTNFKGPFHRQSRSRIAHNAVCGGCLTIPVTCPPRGRTVTCLSGAGWTCDGEPVSVPHTWNAADACDGPGETVRLWTGEKGGDSVGGLGYLKKRAAYRRTLPAKCAGRRYFLKCDGVSVVSDVSVNGRKVGSHVGAFTAFAFDITNDLKPDGESELEITADNRWTDLTQPMAADYSVYGGIYRDVWLIETDPICIDPVTDGADGVRVFADARTGEVRFEVSVLGGTNEVQRLKVDSPRLWSPEEPNLYSHTVCIEQGGSRDAVTVRFGFRTFEFRDGLFYLNGKQRQLRGVNRHQDRAGKGWAVSAADEDEDLRLIKEMGADALRTAHYPASRHVYDLCDELGIVAWCEYPNVNRLTFSDAFETNMLRQVREMVMQNRNHVSIGQWGIFNELYNGEGWMRPKSAELLAMMARTQDLILSLDRTRTVVGVMGEAGIPALNAIPQEYGFNVYPKWYSFMTMREMLDYLFALSGRKTFSISEYGVGASVKQHGDPATPVPAAGMWHPEEYQAYRMHDNLLEMMREPRVWGTYVWAMFDFGADNRTEGDRHGINDKGLVTHDRKTLKDSYYMYQATWTKRPVLHLVGSRMTTVTNDVVSVMGFSNVGPVTLKVNGVSQGVRTPDAACGVLWPDVHLEKGANRIEMTADGRMVDVNWECAEKF